MRRKISFQEDSSYPPESSDLVPSEWFDPNKNGDSNSGSSRRPPPGEPDLESELRFLHPEEREHILEVMRRDTIVKLYTELKVR